MNNEVLVLENVQKDYPMGDETVRALRGIDLEVETGSFTAIMGPSGSGKSTLLHLAGILDTPTQGTVYIEGKDTMEYSPKEQANLRRNKIGFIFQRYNLLSQLTVVENVLLPMIKSDPEKARSLLDGLGLSNKYDRLPGQLSGGEQQRVAIARALSNDPSLILADEPTGELDTENTRMIMQILRKLNEEEGITILVVTHNPIAAEYVTRTITMQDGKIIKDVDK